MKNYIKDQNSIPAGTWPKHLFFLESEPAIMLLMSTNLLTQQNQISAAATTLSSKKRSLCRLKKKNNTYSLVLSHLKHCLTFEWKPCSRRVCRILKSEYTERWWQFWNLPMGCVNVQRSQNRNICLFRRQHQFFGIEIAEEKKDLFLVYSVMFVVGFSITFLGNSLCKDFCTRLLIQSHWELWLWPTCGYRVHWEHKWLKVTLTISGNSLLYTL